MNNIYEKLMRRCFKLALKSRSKNLPNPYVGAIIYDEKKSEIISEGFHSAYGKPHAEVEAINNAKGKQQGKTLIVNLEPCSHFGKTPPCADLIIKSGIKKVIFSNNDPNKMASGGAKKLKEAGIEVISGVLDDEGRELNKIFFKNQIEKKPYVMLKIASTLDGKIALSNGESKWITNEEARNLVQKQRSEYQAIISASGTILNDNPRLNVRLKGKKSPIRIIFDPNNKIPLNYNVFNNDGIRIILINNSMIDCPSHIEQIEFKDFNSLFKNLYKMGIYSIMVEAGCGFNTLLLKSHEVDEINQFIAPKIFGSGLNFVDNIDIKKIDKCINLKYVTMKKIEDNVLIKGRIIKESRF